MRGATCRWTFGTSIRRWYRRTAQYHARMPHAVLFELSDESPLVVNVPRFLYRRLVEEAALWMADLCRGRSALAFLHETRMHYAAAYMMQRWRLESSRAAAGISGC